MPFTENVLGEPCLYRFEINFLQLSPRGPLRYIILDRIKRRRGIQKPLRTKMSLEFSHQSVALGLTPTLDRHAALTIRRGGRRRTKFRA
jgi:hypothetical protein